jgi:hypothetical protein
MPPPPATRAQRSEAVEQKQIWHCDVSGNCSEYGSQTTQTYLRGIQTTDASGQLKVTQIAFPESINGMVYASGVHSSRGSNPTSNVADGIFTDSLASELMTPAGDPASGYVGISV